VLDVEEEDEEDDEEDDEDEPDDDVEPEPDEVAVEPELVLGLFAGVEADPPQPTRVAAVRMTKQVFTQILQL
jgi:hypothetical protein